MKTTKRIFAGLLAVMMLLCTSAFVVLAADDGSITIESTDTSGSVLDREFSFYKIFDATLPTADETKTTYKWTDEQKGNYQAFFKTAMGLTDEDTAPQDVEAAKWMQAELADNSEALNTFAANLYKNVIEGNVNPVNVTKDPNSTDSAVTYTGFGYGYYLVYDTTNPIDGVKAAIALTTITPNKTMKIKSDRPSLEKYIMDGIDPNKTGVKNASATIGETVEYKLISKVPLDLTAFDKTKYVYEITDTLPAGLTLNPDSFKVTNTDENGDQIADGLYVLNKDTHYTLTVEDNTFTIKFDDFMFGEPDPADGVVKANYNTLNITYTAKVTANIALGKNTNNANLKFTNNPYNNTTKEIPSSANLYTYALDITKVKNEAPDQTLPGAEFELSMQGDGKAIAFTETEADGKTTYKVAENGAAGAVTKIKGGNFVIEGLEKGKYILKETKAPDGYKLPDKDFVFELTEKFDTVGKLTLNIIWTVDNKLVASTPETDKSDPTVKFNIANKSASELPETGGIGTTLFTFGGILLMVLALVFFYTKKKGSEA